MVDIRNKQVIIFDMVIGNMCERHSLQYQEDTWFCIYIYDHQGQGLYISYDKLVYIFDNSFA